MQFELAWSGGYFAEVVSWQTLSSSASLMHAPVCQLKSYISIMTAARHSPGSGVMPA